MTYTITANWGNFIADATGLASPDSGYSGSDGTHWIGDPSKSTDTAEMHRLGWTVANTSGSVFTYTSPACVIATGIPSSTTDTTAWYTGAVAFKNKSSSDISGDAPSSVTLTATGTPRTQSGLDNNIGSIALPICAGTYGPNTNNDWTRGTCKVAFTGN